MRRCASGIFGSRFGRFAVWSSDEGLAILRTGSQVFIDATFHVTPHPFAQCLIVMAHDTSTNVHVPCAWALMSGRDEFLYCEVLHVLVVALDYHWSPRAVVVDFEKALVRAVQYQFPESRITGCWFHFRQALHRKIVKLGIERDVENLIMQNLEQLTEYSGEDIVRQLAAMEATIVQSNPSLALFWDYFRRV